MINIKTLFVFVVNTAGFQIEVFDNGPVLIFKSLYINIWSNNSKTNSITFNNNVITFFYPDISNINVLISKLKKLTLFL